VGREDVDAVSALAWSTIEDAIQSWIVLGSGLASDHVIWAQQNAPAPVGEFISMRMSVLEPRGRDWRDRADNFFSIGTKTISAVSTGADTLTITGHGLLTGDGPIQFASSGSLPAPLVAATNYWPVVVDANTIKVASTFQNAVAVVPVVIDLTTAGSGTITIVATTTAVHAGSEIIQKARGPRQAILQLTCFAGVPGGAATGASSPTAVLHDAVSAYALDGIADAIAAAKIGVGRVETIRSIDGVVDSTIFEPRAIVLVHLHLASELSETSTYIQIVNMTDQIPSPPQSLTVALP
jgi:hypothetical protein